MVLPPPQNAFGFGRLYNRKPCATGRAILVVTFGEAAPAWAWVHGFGRCPSPGIFPIGDGRPGPVPHKVYREALGVVRFRTAPGGNGLGRRGPVPTAAVPAPADKR